MPDEKRSSPSEVVQSYLVTSARYNYSVYEKRILYRIVELLQKEIKQIPLSSGVKITPTLFLDREITMPLSVFLLDREGDNHQNRVLKAFSGLISRVMKKETPEKVSMFPLVARMDFYRYQRHVKFVICKELYEDLLDFAKGFSQYELETAFSFRSQYTMRLYELTSKQPRPITYSIDQLRKMFCLEDKYPDTYAFIKRVIDPAEKELKASPALCYFTYSQVKDGKKTVAITFINHMRKKEQEPKNTLSLPSLTKEEQAKLDGVLVWLSGNLDVPVSTFKHHHQLLLDNLNLLNQNRPKNELDIIIKGAKAADASNPVGYVINSLKNRLKSA